MDIELNPYGDLRGLISEQEIQHNWINLCQFCAHLSGEFCWQKLS